MLALANSRTSPPDVLQVLSKTVILRACGFFEPTTPFQPSPQNRHPACPGMQDDGFVGVLKKYVLDRLTLMRLVLGYVQPYLRDPPLKAELSSIRRARIRLLKINSPKQLHMRKFNTLACCFFCFQGRFARVFRMFRSGHSRLLRA
jgi:hypothetical protein